MPSASSASRRSATAVLRPVLSLPATFLHLDTVCLKQLYVLFCRNTRGGRPDPHSRLSAPHTRSPSAWSAVQAGLSTADPENPTARRITVVFRTSLVYCM